MFSFINAAFLPSQVLGLHLKCGFLLRRSTKVGTNTDKGRKHSEKGLNVLPSIHISGVYTKAAGSLFSLVRLRFRLAPARLPQVVQERALTGTVRILLSFQFFFLLAASHTPQREQFERKCISKTLHW